MMNIKELRKHAMYNPQSLSKPEWDLLCEDAFSVPKCDSIEKAELKRKQGKEWW